MAYTWSNRCIPDEQIMDYSNNIMKWAKATYGAYNEQTYLQVVKDNYRGFLEAVNKQDSKSLITRDYNKMVATAEKVLDRNGISTFERDYIGQGWFEYMNYIINNK